MNGIGDAKLGSLTLYIPHHVDIIHKVPMPSITPANDYLKSFQSRPPGFPSRRLLPACQSIVTLSMDNLLFSHRCEFAGGTVNWYHLPYLLKLYIGAKQ